MTAAIAHFYHIWADGDWEPAAAAHAEALSAAGLHPGQFFLGIAGSPANRAKAAPFLAARGFPAETIAEADTGYEEITLRALRDWARTARPATAVLYCHTKGAYKMSRLTTAHRDTMTAGVVGRWREAVRLLITHHAAGCYWDGRVFRGNFWWARAGYLAALPDVPDGTRYGSEDWIGLGRPRAAAITTAYATYGEMQRDILGPPENHAPGVAVPGHVSNAPPLMTPGHGAIRW